MFRSALTTLEKRLSKCQKCIKKLNDDSAHVCKIRIENKNYDYCLKSNASCFEINEKCRKTNEEYSKNNRCVKFQNFLSISSKI